MPRTLEQTGREVKPAGSLTNGAHRLVPYDDSGPEPRKRPRNS